MSCLEIANPTDTQPDCRVQRGPLHWLPIFWARVLFPGTSVAATPLRPATLALVVLLPALALYPCLSFALFEPDEGRYAQIPREMLERGDLLVPTLQGQPYLDKPPLFYWLVMGAYALFGYHDWAARLVPALAIHTSVIVSYVLGRRLLGERATLLGTALLAVSPAFLGMGRLLVLDGLLTLWVTLGLFAIYLAQRGPRLHLGWWFLAAVAAGLGILTKGPVALVLVVVPLLAQRWLTGARTTIGWRGWFVFGAVALAIALPWYVLLCCRLPDFARYFLWQHNVMRFMQPFDHDRPVWFYAPVLALGLLPLTLLTPWWQSFLLSGDPQRARRRSPEMGYLLVSGMWCVFFFSLAGCKLPTYILPACVPLCLALGACVAESPLADSRWLTGLVVAHALLLGVGHYVLIPTIAAQRSPLSQPEALASCQDPGVPVVCFPRNIDSLAFYAGRSDFLSFRSKQLAQLLAFLDQHPRVVILFGHRNSIATLARHLPPHLHFTQQAPLGLCDMAVVERVQSSSGR